MASVTFAGVTKEFDGSVVALRDFSLEVRDGEFVVFVGPSGCGKTTALRMVAGLETVTEGEILIGDRSVVDAGARERDVAMVFQNYALYPHMTVFDNIAFGLRARRVPRGQIRQRVEQIARSLGLESLLSRKPRQLSGGQRQRVAMGRAIVRDPRVFLMDEPLSNLDARLRVQMRAEVARIQRELGATTIYVTHDQVEAMTMGDRVAVIRQGVLQQTDEPQEVFDRPANLFVASFIGSPPMNLVQARIEAGDGSLAARVGEQVIPIPSGLAAARPSLARYADRMVGLGFRPEHLRGMSERREAVEYAPLAGNVRATEALGSEVLVHLEVQAPPVVTEEIREVAGDVDAAALQMLESEALRQRTVLIARLETQTRPDPEDRLEVAIELGRLHFFDLETGLAIR